MQKSAVFVFKYWMLNVEFNLTVLRELHLTQRSHADNDYKAQHRFPQKLQRKA